MPFCIDTKVNEDVVHVNHLDVDRIEKAFEQSEKFVLDIKHAKKTLEESSKHYEKMCLQYTKDQEAS